jgi:hypothetical protein
MARSSIQQGRGASGNGNRDLQSSVRKVKLRRQHVRRELPPLDLRTPSGRRTLPY